MPDVLVIDIGLPDADGRDLCQALRARGVQTPVLFLTARDAVIDRLSGFDAGGDDYLTKPFAFVELVARLQALLRRSGADGALECGRPAARPARPCRLGDARRDVPLTPTEFRLLAKLLARPGRAVRRHDLVRAGWPHGAIVHENTLDAYVARLRRKLQAARAGARDLDRARRRLPTRMSRLGIRTHDCCSSSIAAVVVSRWPGSSQASTSSSAEASTATRTTSSAPARRRSSSSVGSSERTTVDERDLGRRAPSDACIWVFAGRAPARARRAPTPQSTRRRARWPRGPSRFHDVPEADARLYSIPIVDGGKRVGTVVAGVSLSPYEQTRGARADRVDRASASSCSSPSRSPSAGSLRGVAEAGVRMTRQAAEWSEHDLDQRFGSGSPTTS